MPLRSRWDGLQNPTAHPLSSQSTATAGLPPWRVSSRPPPQTRRQGYKGTLGELAHPSEKRVRRLALKEPSPLLPGFALSPLSRVQVIELLEDVIPQQHVRGEA